MIGVWCYAVALRRLSDHGFAVNMPFKSTSQLRSTSNSEVGLYASYSDYQYVKLNLVTRAL